MCKWGTNKAINVIRKNHPNIQDGHHQVYVDACISDYIQRMNDLDIITLSCCCGHGRTRSNVLVEIKSKALMDKYGYKYEPYIGICYYHEALIHYIPLTDGE